MEIFLVIKQDFFILSVLFTGVYAKFLKKNK